MKCRVCSKTIIAAILILSNVSIAQWIKMTKAGDGLVTSFASKDSVTFLGTVVGGMFRSTNAGTSWTPMNSGLIGVYVHDIAINGADVYAGLIGGGVCRLNNEGDSWTPVNVGLTNDHIGSLLAADSTLLAGTNNGAFLSRNRGDTWTNITGNLTYSVVTDFAKIGSLLFVVIGSPPYLCRSNFDGMDWVSAGEGLSQQWGVSALVSQGTNLIASTNGSGVFFSSDSGATWKAMNNGLTTPWITSLAADSTSVFAGSNDGVFITTDCGANWREWNFGLSSNNVNPSGLPDIAIYSLGIDKSCLYASLDSGFIWRRPLLDMATDVNVRTIETPKCVSLAQNYPNPFNPSTSIRYILPTNARVTLTIYDLLGREVATLVDERENAGDHSVTFNGYNLPSGAYFYQLRAGSFVNTKKLVLLK